MKIKCGIFFIFIMLISICVVMGYGLPVPAIAAPPVFIEPRYQVKYPAHFFELGGKKVKYDRNKHLKMGIVIRNRTDLSVPYIIQTIFQTAPFDRYRDFFVFANADEAMRQTRQNNHFITTYDSYAHRIAGGFDWTAMRVRAGLVVLDVNDYEWKRSGTLGYSFEQTAVTQKSTILHELGHALADLGDEYSVGEQENEEVMNELLRSLGKEYAYRMGRGWTRIRDNLEYRTRNPLKWFPLVEQGFLPDGHFNRVKISDGHDVGLFVAPSPVCTMNNPAKSAGKFCPVCQLQIIAKIAQYTGCETPWDDYY